MVEVIDFLYMCLHTEPRNVNYSGQYVSDDTGYFFIMQITSILEGCVFKDS